VHAANPGTLPQTARFKKFFLLSARLPKEHKGIETTIQPMLSNEEEEALKRSVEILKEAAAELKFCTPSGPTLTKYRKVRRDLQDYLDSQFFPDLQNFMEKW